MTNGKKRPVSARLKNAIERRMTQLGYTPTELARATGLTEQGLLNIRNGEIRKYQKRLTLPLTQALRWTPDSIDRLLRNEPPVTWEENLDVARDALHSLEAQQSTDPEVVKNIEWVRGIVARLEAREAQASRPDDQLATQLDEMREAMRILRNDLRSLGSTVKGLTKRDKALHSIVEQHAERLRALESPPGEEQPPIAGGC